MVGGVASHKVYRYYTARKLKKLERKKYKEKLSAVQVRIVYLGAKYLNEINESAVADLVFMSPTTEEKIPPLKYFFKQGRIKDVAHNTHGVRLPSTEAPIAQYKASHYLKGKKWD